MGNWFAKYLIGIRWRNYKLALYNKHYDPSMSKEQNIERNCPKGVTTEQWKGLVYIRDKQKHKVIVYF